MSLTQMFWMKEIERLRECTTIFLRSPIHVLVYSLGLPYIGCLQRHLHRKKGFKFSVIAVFLTRMCFVSTLLSSLTSSGAQLSQMRKFSTEGQAPFDHELMIFGKLYFPSTMAVLNGLLVLSFASCNYSYKSKLFSRRDPVMALNGRRKEPCV